jgi:hypothetical protein
MLLPAGETAHAVDSVPLPIELLVIAPICLVLVTLAVAARVFTRWFDLRHMQLEDCTYDLLLIERGKLTSFRRDFLRKCKYSSCWKNFIY